VTTALPRLGVDVLDDLDRRLAPADADLAARYPGDAGARQPVHTVYVPADLMTPGLAADWGGRAFEDVMKGTDYAEALPYVEKGRTVAAGASFGGYMVNWIAGHTTRFAALVSHDGTFDPASDNLETEELWFPKWEFKGWPWSSSLYAKWSPMYSAGNFKTPTLVVTSEKDYRVPFGQGLMMFSALQIQGVPSRLLMFPDEGHWVLKPGNSCLWHNTIMDWLHRYLGGAEADPKGLAMVYSVTK